MTTLRKLTPNELMFLIEQISLDSELISHRHEPHFSIKLFQVQDDFIEIWQDQLNSEVYVDYRPAKEQQLAPAG